MNQSRTGRVEETTDEAINEQIRRRTDTNIAFYAAHPDKIDQRMDELDAEWDVERWLEANSSILSLAGLVLGTVKNRVWFLLPLVVQSFLLQHAIQGWCPPLPILRRMGIRTAREIEQERFALKALRGDFRDLPESQPEHSAVGKVVEAVRH